MFLVFYIFRLIPSFAFAPEFLVQTYIDSRNLVCDVSAIFRIDSGRKGYTKNLSLEGNCALFMGCILSLNEIALFTYLGFVLSNVHTLFASFFLKKKVASI